VTDSRLNHREIFDRNLKEIEGKQNGSGPKRRRFSIFCHEEPHLKQENVESQLEEFKCREEVWGKADFSTAYVCRAKPSLNLRLFKRIL
jgi:hypothetical protein